MLIINKEERHAASLALTAVIVKLQLNAFKAQGLSCCKNLALVMFKFVHFYSKKREAGWRDNITSEWREGGKQKYLEASEEFLTKNHQIRKRYRPG